MRKILIFAAISCTTIVITACGDDVTNVTEQVGVKSFASIEKFPNCTEANFGEMAISKKNGKLYYCVDSTWVQMNAENLGGSSANVRNGSDGKDGAEGTPGKDGKDGESGTSCTAKEVDDGIEVSCGGDVIGIITHGKNGKDGVDGKNGDKGDAGENCFLEDNDGTVTIKCGDKSANLSKAVCGSMSYDPALQFCYDGEIFEYCNGKTYNARKLKCDNGDIILEDTRDGQKYKVVTIGKQTWMAENLNYRMFFKREGEAAKDSGSFCYGDDGINDRGTENCEEYGRLYTWSAAFDSVTLKPLYGLTCGFNAPCGILPDFVQGACPRGWHIPTIKEFSSLSSNVDASFSGNDTGLHFKSKSGWYQNGNGIDTFGFNVLPAGYRSNEPKFSNLGKNAAFWTVENNDVNEAQMFIYGYKSGNLVFVGKKFYAASIRCVMNPF